MLIRLLGQEASEVMGLGKPDHYMTTLIYNNMVDDFIIREALEERVLISESAAAATAYNCERIEIETLFDRCARNWLGFGRVIL